MKMKLLSALLVAALCVGAFFLGASSSLDAQSVPRFRVNHSETILGKRLAVIEDTDYEGTCFVVYGGSIAPSYGC